jgi:hypothetical protein
MASRPTTAQLEALLPSLLDQAFKGVVGRGRKTEKEITVSEPTLDALEDVFHEVVAAMPKDEFDSHEFILQLAHDHQRLYVQALAAYADTDRPFQIVHGEIARRLGRHKDLVSQREGKTISMDIFGQDNTAAVWQKVK